MANPTRSSWDSDEAAALAAIGRRKMRFIEGMQLLDDPILNGIIQRSIGTRVIRVGEGSLSLGFGDIHSIEATLGSQQRQPIPPPSAHPAMAHKPAEGIAMPLPPEDAPWSPPEVAAPPVWEPEEPEIPIPPEVEGPPSEPELEPFVEPEIPEWSPPVVRIKKKYYVAINVYSSDTTPPTSSSVWTFRGLYWARINEIENDDCVWTFFPATALEDSGYDVSGSTTATTKQTRYLGTYGGKKLYEILRFDDSSLSTKMRSLVDYKQGAYFTTGNNHPYVNLDAYDKRIYEPFYSVCDGSVQYSDTVRPDKQTIYYRGSKSVNVGSNGYYWLYPPSRNEWDWVEFWIECGIGGMVTYSPLGSYAIGPSHKLSACGTNKIPDSLTRVRHYHYSGSYGALQSDTGAVTNSVIDQSTIWVGGEESAIRSYLYMPNNAGDYIQFFALGIVSSSQVVAGDIRQKIYRLATAPVYYDTVLTMWHPDFERTYSVTWDDSKRYYFHSLHYSYWQYIFTHDTLGDLYFGGYGYQGQVQSYGHRLRIMLVQDE